MNRKMRGASQDRTISNTASLIMTLIAVGSLAMVWGFYYNKIVFRTHRELGYIATLLVYLVIYLKSASVYRAFKIASSSIGETAFSQYIALALADGIVYMEGCLIARRYINILPGIFTVMVQFVAAFVWATLTKRYFLAHVEPQKCILIYDASETGLEAVKTFVGKIEKYYGHLFEIVGRIPVEKVGELSKTLHEYPVVFLYGVQYEARSRMMEYCVVTDKKLYLTPNVEDVIAKGFRVKNLIDTPLYGYEGTNHHRATYAAIKRVLDVVTSLIFLIPAAPVMLVTALCIKLEDGGDVFFRQKRVTTGGKVFDILKFRSMVMDAEKDGKPRPCVAGDDRVTKVGMMIRATRIDELPQIFNILSGDMSWVGPRPERVEHVEIFTREIPEFRYRLWVKAGLTGYAQIYGKYNTSAQDKLLLDLLYIEQQSFLLDLKILFLTVKTMFTPEATEGFEEEKSKAINKISRAEEKETVSA